MHDLAYPIDAAFGILRLAVPNAPAQTLDLVDDHDLCLHPAGTVGWQSACYLRRVLDPHCDVEPIEDGPGSGYGAPGEAGVVQPVKVRPG